MLSPDERVIADLEAERDGLRAENERLRSSWEQATNYLKVVRACCGYTVPGGEFDVERDEIEGAMRGIDAWLNALESASALDDGGAS